MHETRRKKKGFFVEALEILSRLGLPFLVGGGHALRQHTGIPRPMRDLDVFVRPSDAPAVIARFREAGYRVDGEFAHWLSKIYRGSVYVDVIFGFGNGVAYVDDLWFEHAVPAEVLGTKVLLCPAEEMLWSKAFIMERERYDGADVSHIILARGPDLDWRRLMERFRPHGLVLLSHLVLFLYTFPSESARVPRWVWEELLGTLEVERVESGNAGPVCRGTLLSRSQYLAALTLGFRDARLVPDGTLRREDVVTWTEAGEEEEQKQAG